MEFIKVRNADKHNLNHINADIPQKKLTVVTGVSGSGKTSFVFDTLYEEGRRYYLKLMGLLESQEDFADSDVSIQGLNPVVAVKQKIIRSTNPRSVVGTKTKILDYLRMLYSVEGIRTDEDGKIQEPLESSYFSFNTPVGMCMKCSGRGYIISIDLEHVLTSENISVNEIMKAVGMPEKNIKKELLPLMKSLNIPYDIEYSRLAKKEQDIILYGIHSKDSRFKFWGIIPYLMYQTEKNKAPEELTKKIICPECEGFRIGEEARSTCINGSHIGQLSKMPIAELNVFLTDYSRAKDITDYGRNLVRIILRKIKQMFEVELHYLSLYREIPTLSGGELQRLFLMSVMDTKMESLLCIFDEPTAGLHETEKCRLLDKIEEFLTNDNTVIIVEHDRNTIKRAEHIIDFGPYAGIHGGDTVYQGNYEDFLNSGTVISSYLSGESQMPVNADRIHTFETRNTKYLILEDSRINNLKGMKVSIPLNCIVGIAGLSGSGKSSLIFQALVPTLKKNRLLEVEAEAEAETENTKQSGSKSELIGREMMGTVTGAEHIQHLCLIAQAPIGRNSRSVIATYLNIWEGIRTIFAEQKEAKGKKMKKEQFSFNSRGACSFCKGLGVIETAYEYLGTFKKNCPECMGRRYEESVLSIKWKGYNIYELLCMTVEEAVPLFCEYPDIHSLLTVLNEMQMGYITLGQSTTTLSGGESQRLKLAKELGRKERKETLYIMDEPTTGLSFYDTAKLLDIINGLNKNGNSVIIIEHDCDVLSFCDYIIEMGPGSGGEGGFIIAEGTPSQLKNNDKSLIGTYLNI